MLKFLFYLLRFILFFSQMVFFVTYCGLFCEYLYENIFSQNNNLIKNYFLFFEFLIRFFIKYNFIFFNKYFSNFYLFQNLLEFLKNLLKCLEASSYICFEFFFLMNYMLLIAISIKFFDNILWYFFSDKLNKKC